jgi:hypothetical protein
VANSASIVRLGRWGEDVKQTLQSIGTSFEKIDTLSARRVLITLLTGGKLMWLAPSDEGSSDRGIFAMLSTASNIGNEPGSLEIGLNGNPPLWACNDGAGSIDISVLHFYDDATVSGHDGPKAHIEGWGEETKLKMVSLTTTFQKVDYEGCERIIIAPAAGGKWIYASPTDEGTNAAGAVCVRNNTTTNRNAPALLDLEPGGAPLYLRGSDSFNASLILLKD